MLHVLKWWELHRPTSVEARREIQTILGKELKTGLHHADCDDLQTMEALRVEPVMDEACQANQAKYWVPAMLSFAVEMGCFQYCERSRCSCRLDLVMESEAYQPD